MKKQDCWILLNLLVLLIFFAGCASMNAKKDDKKTAILEKEGQQEKGEQIDNVKVSEFILGVGDTIEIAVFRHDELKQSVKINPTGRTMFPLIGDVSIAGKGVFELRDDLQNRLSKYIVDPQVQIGVTMIQSQKIIVLGEVNSPGIFNLDSTFRVTEAIARAGGYSRDAKINNILLIRRGQGKADISVIDFKKIRKKGDISRDPAMENGDIVYVPATTIANVYRFFSYIQPMLNTLLSAESGIVLYPQARDVLRGKGAASTLAIPTH